MNAPFGTWEQIPMWSVPSGRVPRIVGLHIDPGAALLHLLSHYKELIVYMGYSLWRKMLFIQPLKPVDDGPSPLQGRRRGIELVNPHHLGMNGALYRIHNLFLPSLFLRERRPVTGKNIVAASPDPTGATRDLDAFFVALVRSNQRDVIHVMVKELQYDCHGCWDETRRTWRIRHLWPRPVQSTIAESWSRTSNPLLAAAQEGHEVLAEMLLKKNWNPDYYGLEPLSEAVEQCHAATVKTLLKHGASVGYNSLGFSALHTCAIVAGKYWTDGGEDTLRLLLEANDVEINLGDKHSSRTALHIAAEAVDNTRQVVKVLLKYGADPCAVDEDGNVPEGLEEE